MKRYPILEICARVEGHRVQHHMLRQFCRQFEDWQGLLKQAEREGMAPLLRKHLIESESIIPATVRRSLHILQKRHQKTAEVRLKVLEELLILFRKHQITPILIKGAALCQTLYPDPALRPMRDIDILLSPDEVDSGQQLLRSAGFTQAKAPIPPDHYHLPSLHKTVAGVQVCIELHRGLYPNISPHYPLVDFNTLLETGRKIKVGEREVVTFSNEETLHYLYQHGFRAPLTYEAFKLVNAADIISFTEKYFQDIDWKQVKERYPQFYRALPMMHHVAPWNVDKVPDSFFPRRNRQRKYQPVPFSGWPQRRRKEFRSEKVSLFEILTQTFLPSGWWLRVYYGAGYSFYRSAKALCFDHPKNVFCWAYFYARLHG